MPTTDDVTSWGDAVLRAYALCIECKDCPAEHICDEEATHTHGLNEAIIEELAARLATERKVSEWLADECAALDTWADVNDLIGYQRTGDAPAWLEAARKAVADD